MSFLIKELPDEEKPREKAIKLGIDYLTDSELLAIILRTGKKEKSVKDMSIELLKEINGLKGLKDIRLQSLLKIDGIGNAKAVSLLAAVELGKRLNREEVPKRIQILETKDVYKYYHYRFDEETQEKFFVLFLDSKNYVINEKILFIGTANKSIIHSRDIYKEAVLNNALKILCVHNHPTGDPTPSREDKEITKLIKNTGDIIGIPLIDHIILGRKCYFSFLEREMIT